MRDSEKLVSPKLIHDYPVVVLCLEPLGADQSLHTNLVEAVAELFGTVGRIDVHLMTVKVVIRRLYIAAVIPNQY